MWTGYCTQKMFLNHSQKLQYIIIIVSLSSVNIHLKKDISFVYNHDNRSTCYFPYFSFQHTIIVCLFKNIFTCLNDGNMNSI